MQYRFLIYISYNYSIPIGLPLEAEILKRGYSVKWFCDLDGYMAELSTKNNVLATIKEVLSYQPHIILTITDKVPDFINALKVQVFHGFNAEKRSFRKDHFRIRGFFDLYCTQGPSTTSIFNLQKERYKTFKVIETGWSKVDPLFPIMEKKVGNPPVVFIASTFTPRLSLALNDEVFRNIKKLAEDGTFQFIMVLHPKISAEIINKWKQLNSDYFSYHDTTDLIPLIKKADVMLSDTTSAIQEFMLQEKPIVTINHHIPKPHFINITKASEIETAIEKALTYPKQEMELMKSYIRDLHPYNDGASSKRVIDASITFLHSDKSDIKRKPLNLVRKYKLRKQLKYYTLKSYNKPFTVKLNV
jgi:CDP-glycerol glycerophosphotransferase (TagB/SpsB family)